MGVQVLVQTLDEWGWQVLFQTFDELGRLFAESRFDSKMGNSLMPDLQNTDLEPLSQLLIVLRR